MTKKISILVLLLCLGSCGLKELPSASHEAKLSIERLNELMPLRSSIMKDLTALIMQKLGKVEQEQFFKLKESIANESKSKLVYNQLSTQIFKQRVQRKVQIDKKFTALLERGEAYPGIGSNPQYQKLLDKLESVDHQIDFKLRIFHLSAVRVNKLIKKIPTSWYNSILLHLKELPEARPE